MDEGDRQGFVRYCEELDCLHEDLGFILSEPWDAVTLHYGDNLNLKRLALVYHEDNFYFRVHAYREKLLRLMNHGFGFKIPDRPEVRMRLKQERLERIAR